MNLVNFQAAIRDSGSNCLNIVSAFPNTEMIKIVIIIIITFTN